MTKMTKELAWVRTEKPGQLIARGTQFTITYKLGVFVVSGPDLGVESFSTLSGAKQWAQDRVYEFLEIGLLELE